MTLPQTYSSPVENKFNEEIRIIWPLHMVTSAFRGSNTIIVADCQLQS